jgi:catechol 2,3-dioxygenase-like lactoylglutathione lyase family enzyme
VLMQCAWDDSLTMTLARLVPMLSVEDLDCTIAFYRDRLGFKVMGTFGSPKPVWCHLKRDDVSLMFNFPGDYIKNDLPRRAKDFQIYYIYPRDVAALHATWRASGVPVSDLRVTDYGMKEFELRDPDGYWLWFGQDTAEPPAVGQ